jgi:hypothetical protein
MSTISSGTTLTTALVQTGDTTGNLVIKTGSSNTTAMTISGSNQSVTFAGAVNVSSSAFANGSASAPSITFTGDTNTGIFSPAADTIAFTEGGAESMRITSTGNVGIGTSSPNGRLNIAAAQDGNLLALSDNSAIRWAYYLSSNALRLYNYATSSDAMTVDASSKVLIGRTSDNTAFGGKLQVEGTSDAFASLVRYSSNAAGNPAFYFGRSKSATLGTNTIVASGDALGSIVWSGANGTGYSDAAYIQALVDGTPGASADMPGRLVFSTSADGSATPTERMRIDSSGNVGIGTTSPSVKMEVRSAVNSAQLVLTGTASRGLKISTTNPDGQNDAGVIYNAQDTEGGGVGTHTWQVGGVSRMNLTAAGLLQFNSGYGSVATAYGCRAWVNFNGTGTVAIRASGNVSSITDNGTGDYTVNFTTAMPDANYSAVASSRQLTASGYLSVATDVNTSSTNLTRTTTAYQFQMQNVVGGLNDNPWQSVAVFR